MSSEAFSLMMGGVIGVNTGIARCEDVLPWASLKLPGGPPQHRKSSDGGREKSGSS